MRIKETHSFRSRGKAVSAEDCGELRRLARDGLSPAAAIEEIGLDIQPVTAKQHANDYCTFSIDVPSKPFVPQQRGISAEN